MSKVLEEQILDMKENDIVSKLMGTFEIPEATFIVERLGIPINLKGLTDKEISKIKKDCTYPRKVKGGKIVEKLDGNEFDAGLIIAATTNFDWNNKDLLDSTKSSDGKKFIGKKLLAGEISALTDKILGLSGFDDELEKVEEEEDIKN